MARDRDGHRGTAHKAASVLLRLGELVSAIIVLGILSRFCYLLSLQLATANGRVVYTMVVAGIGIIFSFFLCIPFDVLFMSFPFDFVLFIMWLVAFCLLEAVWLPMSLDCCQTLADRGLHCLTCRKVALILALRDGIITTGASTGAGTGDKVLPGRSSSVTPVVGIGGLLWAFRSLLVFAIFSVASS